MSQPNKLLLCHLLLLLLASASASAAEAHNCISGNQFRWPRCVPELAHTMNGQPLGTTVHAAQGSTVEVDDAVDGGLIANTYKARHGVARSAGHNGMVDVPAVPVGPVVGPRPYDWKEHGVLVVRYGAARPAEPRGMIRVLAVPEGLEAESHAYDRPDHAFLLMRYGLALSVGRSSMNVVSVLEVTEEEGPFAYHREHAVHLTRDGTQRSAGLNGRMAMSLPAGSEAESFAYRREHDDRRKRSTYEQADTGLASIPLVWISQIPRPTILAVQGAAADVTVKNFSLTEHVAIHWHGIRQIGTPWADGTEGVAQCPIPPGDTFTYRFVVDQPGAYTRHVHHGVQRSPGLNLNGTTFVAVPPGQAEPFAYSREHTDVRLEREDTRHTAGRDNGMTAVLVQGCADAETLACDCDYPVVPLDEWWNWHAQAAAGVAAVLSVLVGEPQLSLSYSVRASLNCSLLASGIRDATRPNCLSPAPFTVAASKTYHIVTNSGLLFDRAVHLNTAVLIALIMVVQVALDDQRRKNGGGRDVVVAMALLILLLVIASLPNAAMAARPLHGGGGVHDQTAVGPVAAEPAGLMPESKVAAGSACTNDPNTQDPHRCIHH